METLLRPPEGKHTTESSVQTDVEPKGEHLGVNEPT